MRSNVAMLREFGSGRRRCHLLHQPNLGSVLLQFVRSAPDAEQCHGDDQLELVSPPRSTMLSARQARPPAVATPPERCQRRRHALYSSLYVRGRRPILRHSSTRRASRTDGHRLNGSSWTEPSYDERSQALASRGKGQPRALSSRYRTGRNDHHVIHHPENGQHPFPDYSTSEIFSRTSVTQSTNRARTAPVKTIGQRLLQW